MHYICTGGCRGISETPGNCGEETCPKHNHPLDSCECVDGTHGGAFKVQPGEEEEEEIEEM